MCMCVDGTVKKFYCRREPTVDNTYYGTLKTLVLKMLNFFEEIFRTVKHNAR